MWKPGYRDEIWSRLDTAWDVVVVGGGITGAGVLAEASRAGLRALLVEARDFASGTSSRSSKLVHGGLRYLRQGQIHVTRESVRERERLMREAKGLVVPLGFYLTTFERDKTPGWLFGLGLAVYDLIALKWAHERYGAEALVAREPALRGAPVRGGYHYFDAQTDDARLVMRVLHEAVARGGTALNYAPATELLRTADGTVAGVVVTDSETGRTKEVRARAVINATGAWADDLRKKLGGEARLRVIRGSHLVIPHDRLPVTEAVSMLHPRDGRAVFALPWEGVTLVGTTDVDHDGSMETEPRIASSEAEYLLDVARSAFPALELRERDIRSTWAGVRPVIDTGAKDPSKESREHALWHEKGLLTVSGGKLTTFRVMAHEALRAIAPEVPEVARIDRRGRIFDDLTVTASDAARASESAAFDRLPDAVRARLVGRHGANAAAVAACGDASPIEATPALGCELRWAARAEGIVHLDDLLLRRVRIGNLLEGGADSLLSALRTTVQPDLGWDDTMWEKEVVRYRALWKRGYGTDFGA